MSNHVKPNDKIFHVVMIKPSHYGDDGYVIQWARSAIPSNTLAALYGLTLDCAERQILGPNVKIELHAYDELNTRIKPKQIARRIQSFNGGGLVMLAGVQTNQYPRALDLARQFRSQNIPVCIGGFHVSGCLAMLPEVGQDLQEAMDLGVSLFAGELEGHLEGLLQDAFTDTMKPLYNVMNNLPDLGGSPVPFLPAAIISRQTGTRTSFDAGRGCPFQCSFCTIINVQGRKSRFRTADDIERLVRANLAQGLHNFFISDDNFARNKMWEPILDRIISLQEAAGYRIRLIIQVDTSCHKVPGFIEKARRAGVDRVFIGLETINPDALLGAQKRQNLVSEYRAMLQAWHNIGAITYAGYILGFPADTPESILKDIQTIQRELPIDVMEFFVLTPLPGSQDHRVLYDRHVEMDKDMNRYDLAHITTAHPVMSKQDWHDIYWKAWDAYYSPKHIETVIRRGMAWGFEPPHMLMKLISFHGLARIERVHPLEGGLFRLKFRKDRRPGMPLEHPLVFYGRILWEWSIKHGRLLALILTYRRAMHRAKRRGPATHAEDLAMLPAGQERSSPSEADKRTGAPLFS